MKSYLAQDKLSGKVYGGCLTACLQWSFMRLKVRNKSVVAIIKYRVGDQQARVIAEIDDTGGRWIFRGRVISKREIYKLVERASHG